MTNKITLSPRGLYTDGNAINVPSGALRQADNVSVTRPNLIEPRPGFGRWPSPSLGTFPTKTPEEMVSSSLGDVVVFAKDASTAQRDIYALKSERTFSNVGFPHSPGYYGYSTLDSGGALHFTTDSGVKKLPGLKASDTVDKAGLEFTDSAFIAQAALDVTVPGSFGTGGTAFSGSFADEAARVAVGPYVSADIGKYCVQTDTGTVWRLIRLDIDVDPNFTPTWEQHKTSMPTNTSAAFRLVVRRESAGGRVQRSSPSSRVVVENSSTTSRANIVFWNVTLPTWVKEDDYIEFYRSVTTTPYTTTPSDELFFCDEVQVTAAMISAKTLGELVSAKKYAVKPYINTLDSELGASLYTSPSQQGIAKANFPPPNLKCLAEFQGCAFGGNLSYPQDRSIKIKDISGKTTGLEGEATYTGLQCGYIQGKVALDAPNQINDVVDVSGLSVGMAVGNKLTGSIGAYTGPWEGTTYFEPDTLITEINHDAVAGDYNLTLNKDAKTNSGGSPIDIGVFDVITVNGVVFYYMFSAGDTIFSLLGASNLDYYRAFTGLSIDTVSRSLAWAITSNFNKAGTSEVAASVFENAKGEITVNLFRPHLSALPYASTFSVSSSRGSAVEPSLETNLSSASSDKVARLVYAKPGLPEAWPLLNYMDIGEDSRPILALQAGEESLYVFKEDGIWRVTGFPSDSWRVDRVSHARLLHPKATCVLDETVFAWTDRGVLSLTGPSTLPVSSPLIGNLLSDKEALYAPGVSSGQGTRMFASPSLGMVFLCLPLDLAQEASEEWWAFSTKTGAWSRWIMDSYAACYSADGAPASWPNGFASGTQKSSGQILFAKKAQLPTDDDGNPVDTSVSVFDIRSQRVLAEGTPLEELSADGIFAWGFPFADLSVAADISGKDVTFDAASIGQWVPRANDVLAFDLSSPTSPKFVVQGTATLSTEQVFTSSGEAIYTADGSVIFDDSVDSYTVTLDSDPGITSSTSLAVWESITSEVMFQAHVGNPHAASNWRNMEVHLQECSVPSLTDAKVAMGASNESTTSPSTVDATVLKTSAQISQTRPVISLIPRDVRRSSTLYPYFRVSGAGWSWCSAGISLEYNKKGRPSR